MRFLDGVKLDYSDVLLVPQRSELSSRSEVNLTRNFTFRYAPFTYTGTPIIVANMDFVGTISMARALTPYNIGVALHKFYPKEVLAKYFNNLNYDNPHTFYTMGISDYDMKKFWYVFDNEKNKPNYICIDIANGYSTKLVDFVQLMRENFPDACIMAGNVVTPDMVHDLLLKGADIVKIGIGSGSVCTTRSLTGCGYPQLSAVIECANAAHGIKNGLICADGGITCPGDIVKAFGAGADFVMCGGLFAGHSECEGELIGELKEIGHTINGKISSEDPISMSLFVDPNNLKMKFHGMSSKEAMELHYGGKADYRAAEGKEVEIPYKGPIKNTIEEILGGVRSACTYIGADGIKQISKCTNFVRVNRQLNNVFGN